MELRNYINILLRRKWVIILTVVATMLVVGIGTRMQVPAYQASTTLRIAVSVGGQLNYLDYMYADRLMNTYVDIATGRPLLEELVKRLDLDQPPDLKAEIIPNTGLIKITVEDSDPKRAALIANTLADILILQSNQLYTGGGKSSLEILGEQLAQIRPDLDQTRQEYEKLIIPTSSAPEKIKATRQVLQVQQTTYATLLGQYNQARIRQEIQANRITIIGPAMVPQSPSQPRILLNYVLGLMIGLLGGLGLAFVFASLDTALYTTEAIETAAELTALAKIPKAYKKEINIFQDGFSQLDEAFRNLATNIQISDGQSQRKVFLVISAEPNQGKSLVVYRLAYALAEFGKNVVVVDCDARLPKLHRLFALSNEQGLTDVLEQKVSLKDALQVSSYNGVSVLTSGSLPSHPPKLLSSAQMVNLIDSLSQQFDYVLLDTPALLAAADITGVVPNVDQLLLIVRRGFARRKALQTVKRVLAGFQFRGKPIDLIVNQAENNKEYNDYRSYRKLNMNNRFNQGKLVGRLGDAIKHNQPPADLAPNNDPNALCLVSEGRDAYYTVKRIVDLILAFILLILFSPLMLLIAAAILIYSPGPILFKQERVGVRRQAYGGYSYWKRMNFQCYKFRTMKLNADPSIHQAYVKALIENDEAQMTALQGAPTQPRKLVNDSRIIRPGKLLRKLSLDELPQFWNVLRGDMSLVGPRPAIPYEVEMYKPWHLRRLGAQPGITGLQQVTARCTADFDRQVQLDIEYINRQSLWLDLKIILRTSLAVISTTGAH